MFHGLSDEDEQGKNRAKFGRGRARRDSARLCARLSSLGFESRGSGYCKLEDPAVEQVERSKLKPYIIYSGFKFQVSSFKNRRERFDHPVVSSFSFQEQKAHKPKTHRVT